MSSAGGLDFAPVCRRYRPVVSRFVVSLVRHTELRDVEDLVQVVFLRAWRAWPSFVGTAEEQVRALLFTIARRAVADRYRYRAGKQLRFERSVAPGAEVFDGEVGADHAERVCELVDLTAALAAAAAAGGDASRAVALRLGEQLAWRDVARRLGRDEMVVRRLVGEATGGRVGAGVRS
jgi:RNA polymerase sigma factor (sigma-70 family)